jgi:hypothetical protein
MLNFDHVFPNNRLYVRIVRFGARQIPRDFLG